MKIVEQSVKLLKPYDEVGGVACLKAIEYAGRNCYRSHSKITDNSYDGFVKSLIERGHTSPLEFADMTVEIVTGRDVLAEITRHRLASFAVQSQRYVMDDESGDISFIKPNFYLHQSPLSTDANKWCASRCWEDAMIASEKRYKYLIRDCHMKPEDARKILPNSTACVIVMKANIREWRYIMKLRSSLSAYPEMRTMMRMLVDESKKRIPVVFESIGE